MDATPRYTNTRGAPITWRARLAILKSVASLAVARAFSRSAKPFDTSLKSWKRSPVRGSTTQHQNIRPRPMDNPITSVDKLEFLKRVAADDRLNATDLRCCIYIADYFNAKKGRAWPSYGRLCKDTNTSRASACSRARENVRESPAPASRSRLARF
jgi:hypothetical protein